MTRLAILVVLILIYYAVDGIHDAVVHYQESSHAHEEKLSLPEQCAHLYEPGNTDPNSPWKQCMGVGVKP